MCRNHSHMKVVPTGFVRVGETTLIEYRVQQPLVLELPYGEKWTRSAMTALWVPVSMQEPLPASTQAQMVVYFTPLSCTVDGDMTAMPEMVKKQIAALPSGPIAWRAMDSYRTNMVGGYDEDLPF